MSISSWLFGKKKSPSDHDQKPVTNTEDAAEEADEFVVIERRKTTVISTADYIHPHLPYDLGPHTAQMSSNPPHALSRIQSIDIDKHILDDVPFKLSAQLTSIDMNNLRETSVRVSDILFKVKRMDQRHYDYDFNLENSITSERG